MTPTSIEVQAAREALRRGGKSAAGVSAQWLRKHCGFGAEVAAAVLEELCKPEPPPPPPPETREVVGDKQTFTGYSKDRITSLDQLLAFCGVDADEWEVERYTVNKWEVGARTEAGIVVEPLFQVKAWLRRKVALISAREEIDRLLDKLSGNAPFYPKIKAAAAPTGNLLELSLPDAHFGKLAWGQETGHGNYDLKISQSDFKNAFAALLQRTSGYKFDRVLLIPGNDYLNANNNENTTANGTPQSCDGRQHKTFRVACDTAIWTIEQSLGIAKHVDVLPVPGNHDPDAVFYLGEVLAAWFRNCNNVHIDNAPTERKFYQWGDVGLMFTHKGGKGKDKTHRNRLLMATERRKMWGETRFNEIHTGDLHQVRLEEEFGVRVRILPSLCPPDAWHAREGYVGNIRSAEAYVWNKTQGLLATTYYNVMDDRSAA
jgi:hypothetical protein